MQAWAGLKRIDIGPSEVAALMKLEIAFRYDEEPTTDEGMIKKLSRIKSAHDKENKPAKVKPHGR